MGLFKKLLGRKRKVTLLVLNLPYRYPVPQESRFGRLDALRQFLKRDGLRTVEDEFGPDWGELRKADVCLEPPIIALTIDVQPALLSQVEKRLVQYWEFLCDITKNKDVSRLQEGVAWGASVSEL